MLRIEIDGIENLIAFVKIIRGEDLDTDALKAITDTITKNTDALKKAVQTQGETDAKSSS
jgi:hypothetical protein